MPIWFVYRSPYEGPASKHVRRLEGPDTLLGWFRSIWRAIPDAEEAVRYADSLVGTHVYRFGNLFRNAAGLGYDPPADDEDLHGILSAALYVLDFHGEADAIAVHSEHDELRLAMYWFTDAYAAANPERVAWLLHDDWRLPDVAGPGGFEVRGPVTDGPFVSPGEGALYDWYWYWERWIHRPFYIPFDRLRGMRLPDLVPWMLTLPVEEADASQIYIVYSLRAPLHDVLLGGEGLEAGFRRSLLEDPSEPATWAAYTDWLAEQGLPRAELRLLELAARLWQGPDVLVDLGEHHLSIACREGEGRYDQWIFFDDVWASGNERLAQSLIAYARGWNVLGG